MVFFAFAIVTIGWLVVVGAERIAKIKTEGVGPERWVYDGEIVLADLLGVVAVVFVKALL